MLEPYSPRQFITETEIVHLGEGLLHCRLARAEWTHEAHFAATLYLVLRKPALTLEADLPGLIRRFNESVGGENTDTAGYHDTLTQCYLAAIRQFARDWSGDEDLLAMSNALARSAYADRKFPLRHWTHEALFSVAARRHWLAPDLAPLPFPLQRVSP